MACSPLCCCRCLMFWNRNKMKTCARSQGKATAFLEIVRQRPCQVRHFHYVLSLDSNGRDSYECFFCWWQSLCVCKTLNSIGLKIENVCCEFAVDHCLVYLRPVEEDDNTYINAVSVKVSLFMCLCYETDIRFLNSQWPWCTLLHERIRYCIIIVFSYQLHCKSCHTTKWFLASYCNCISLRYRIPVLFILPSLQINRMAVHYIAQANVFCGNKPLYWVVET